MKRGKKALAAAAVDRERLYSPLEAVRLAKEIAPATFTRRSKPTSVSESTRASRPAGPRHGIAAAWNRQDGAGRRLRAGRQGQGGRGGRRRHRGRRRPGREDRRRIPRLRCNHRDGRSDEQGRPPGQDSRHAGPDAQPKLGTVTMDVARVVGELKAGRVEYRADKYGIAHVAIGRSPSPPKRSSRTTVRCWTRSCARSRRPPRAATSSRSPSRPPWAPASRSTH